MNAINQKELGIFRKFNVTRTDGKDAPGEKHEGDEYFVLNLTTDKHAVPALSAYSDSCAIDYPVLAADLRAKLPATIKAANIESNKFAAPLPNEGEIYVGAIVQPDGSGHHIYLLPGDHDDADWNAAMEWAKSVGGDLPDRVEQAMLHKYLNDQFQKDYYWSNTQHASNSDYAWYLSFYYGYQIFNYKSAELRARAVRRSAI